MLTRKRITLPVLSGDWKVDGPNVLKAISDYLLSLEQKGALAITEAEISGTVGAGNLDLNGNDLIIDADGDTYLHEVSDDVVALVTGGTERTRWDSGGKVGFGLTPDSGIIKVGVDTMLQVRASGTTLYSRLEVHAHDYVSLPSYSNAGLQYNGKTTAGNQTYNPSMVNANTSQLEVINCDGFSINVNNASPIAFATSATERMRIDSSGNVGIGVTPSYKLHVGSGQIAAPDGSAAAPAYTFASTGNADTGIYLPASNEVAVAGAGAMLTTFKTDRLTFASGYHVTTATATGTTPALQSGTYTPTFTNVANCDSFTARQAQWMRVGNVVTVSGRVEVDFTSAATATSFRCSLPMASNFADAYDCAGVAVCNTSAVSGTKVPFYVLADSTNDEASISGEAPNTASNIVIFTFTFEVL